LILRQQPDVARRKAPQRLVVSNLNRLIFASLNRFAAAVLGALVIDGTINCAGKSACHEASGLCI